MTDPLSNLSAPKLRKAKTNLNTEDTYSRIIAAIKADPTVMLDPSRAEDLAALKLFLPERIRSLKFARRQVSVQLEEILDDIKNLEISIALAVREEKDSVTSKPLYPNQNARDAQEILRRSKNQTYQGLLSHRRKTFSILYGYDEDIEYLERIDISLLEILALTTAQLESNARTTPKNPPAATRRAGRTITEPAPVGPVPATDAGERTVIIGGDNPQELS